MKKYRILGFFSFLFLSWNSSAQITITSADIVTPGRVTYQAYDTMPVISVGPAGTNQVWNFAGLLNEHSVDTLLYISLADAANYMDFPSTNLVIPVNSHGDYLYAVNASSDLSVVATTENTILFPGGEKTTIVKANTPAEKLIQFPATYNTYFTDYHKSFTQYFYGSVPPNFASPANHNRGCGLSDSLREKTIIDKTVLVDAWGTITTLAGTYDAIRFKETKITHDTIEAHDALLYAWFLNRTKADSTITYFWYANNVGVPLVTATMDSAGAVKHVTWLAAPLGTTGINEASVSVNVNVFPNPAQNEITFNVDSKVNSILIYDITGRLIDTYPVTTDKLTINTSAYTNGIYTYSLLSKKQAVLNRGKFSVVK